MPLLLTSQGAQKLCNFMRYERYYEPEAVQLSGFAVDKVTSTKHAQDYTRMTEPAGHIVVSVTR